MPDTPPAEPGVPGEPRDTLPPLVSIIARHNRNVELLLAVIVLGLVLVLGGLIVLALTVAAGNGTIRDDLTWVGSAALLAGLLIGALGVRRGHRRNRPMMPWALLGALVWVLPTVWLLVQVS